MYYVQQDGYQANWVFLDSSNDGINFTRIAQIYPGNIAPTSSGAPDVKYVDGWNVWFMVSNDQAADGTALFWNISRDGIHWLPWDSGKRRIPHPTTGRPIHNPGIIGNASGHIGNGGLGQQSFDVLFGDGNPFDLKSDIGGMALTLTPEPATGHLDQLDYGKIASGWAYDPDNSTNDASSNGSAQAPLGFDSKVRVVATDTTTGTIRRGPWQAAAVPRQDLVQAKAAPDIYHGFRIDLTRQGLPSGNYRVRVEVQEFPYSGQTTMLSGELTASVTCAPILVTLQPASTTVVAGSSGTLSVGASSTLPVTYQWYQGSRGDTSHPVYGANAPTFVTPTLGYSTTYFVRISNECTLIDSDAATVFVEATPDRLLSLKTYAGWYVSAVNGGGGAVDARAVSAGTFETFVLRDLNEGQLQSGDEVNLICSNGNFVVAESGGGPSSVVNCNRASAAEWERFYIVKIGGAGTILPGDTFALKAYCTGYHVVAELGGSADVNCNRTVAAQWESFTYVPK